MAPFPKYNRQNVKKPKLQSDPPNFANALKSNKPTARRAANWGSAAHDTTSRFTGAVPELFVFNCKDKPDEGDVKSYLEGKGLNIVCVKMMSPLVSLKRSFKVTVATYSDYEKVISGGQYLPSGVGVKRFDYPRRGFKSHGTFTSGTDNTRTDQPMDAASNVAINLSKPLPATPDAASDEPKS